MHITHISLKALASVAVFARHAAASANLSNSSTERLSPIVVDSIPAPDTQPEFKFDFNVIFEGGKCSASQQAAILLTMKNIAGFSKRARLWKEDEFHDWSGEVTHWFGESAHTQAAWIRNNFLRVSTAINLRKIEYTNTWLWVGCDYGWTIPNLACNPYNHAFNFLNKVAWFNRYDRIFWNICPGFWSLPTAPDKIQSTIDDPRKNIHYMENYLNTREQWLFSGIISIRSIGIKESNVGVHQTYHNFWRVV
ncbi:hypothetical protein HO133_004213 [Letharia lupina]|uniref:Uncharacterized protein n=1 Tax=Letharia lupina TaxID=560253 RepID=A0A8H6KZG4_9LECA|nr:uncharacterized protein HO133_004213 [Letharia lupina]KAF6229876.1 hypothetical protein HO133_004213 [Letharia lupina]